MILSECHDLNKIFCRNIRLTFSSQRQKKICCMQLAVGSSKYEVVQNMRQMLRSFEKLWDIIRTFVTSSNQPAKNCWQVEILHAVTQISNLGWAIQILSTGNHDDDDGSNHDDDDDDGEVGEWETVWHQQAAWLPCLHTGLRLRPSKEILFLCFIIRSNL